MPTNKNAQLRYKLWDECFSNRQRCYTIADLQDCWYAKYGVPVSRRTVCSDIQAMRLEFRADIEPVPFDGKKCYYRYKDPHYSIYNTNLEADEVEQLQALVKMLQPYRGLQNEWLEEILAKLSYKLGVSGKTQALVSFEHNDQLTGLAYLSTLIEAVTEQYALRITYRSYKRLKAERFVFFPYYLKQYNGRWFLLGEKEKEERLAILALDRIEKVQEATALFRRNTRYDFATYFDSIVGVSKPEGVEETSVLLRFSLTRLPYVVSKPIHRSQTVINREQGLVELKVVPNRELEQQLLSFGADVEVVAPQAFREQVQQKIAETYKKYFGMQNDCTFE